MTKIDDQQSPLHYIDAAVCSEETQSSQDGSAENSINRPTLKIDWALYETYLENSDLTDDQKKEFIETLWSIVVSFVDLGFGIDPTYQALADKNKADSGTPSPDSATIRQEKLSEGM